MLLELSSAHCITSEVSDQSLSDAYYLRSFQQGDSATINTIFFNAHRAIVRTLSDVYAVDCVNAYLDNKAGCAYPSSNAIDPTTKSRTYTIIACRRGEISNSNSQKLPGGKESVIAGAISYVHEANNSRGALTTLCVAPECQGQGVARKLINAVIILAHKLQLQDADHANKEPKCGILELSTPHDNWKAQHLYESFGFQQVGINTLGADAEKVRRFHLKCYELQLMAGCPIV